MFQRSSICGFLLFSLASCHFHDRRFANTSSTISTSSSAGGVLGDDCTVTSYLTSTAISTETFTTVFDEEPTTIASPFVSTVTVTGSGAYVTVKSTSTSTIVHTEGAIQSGSVSSTTEQNSLSAAAAAPSTTLGTSATSSTSPRVTARATIALRDTSTSQSDACPSSCSPCSTTTYTVHVSEVVSTTMTETVAAITRSTVVSTVTVQPFTLTSIQAVIQVTTTTVKAGEVTTPAPAPAHTPSTKASQPNPTGLTSGPAATSSVKTNQPAQASGSAATSNVKTSQPAQASGLAASSNVNPNQPSQPTSSSPPAITPFVAPLLTLGGSTYTPNPSSDYLVGGSTLVPGGPPVTVSGTVYSLSPGATKLIIGAFSTNAAGSVQVKPTTLQLTPATITPVQPGPSSAIVVGGTTLVPGAPAATINGTPVSLASGSSFIVIGSSTAFLTPTGSSGLGPAICSGLGGCESSTTTASGAATYSGEAAVFKKSPSRQKVICAMGVAVQGILLF